MTQRVEELQARERLSAGPIPRVGRMQLLRRLLAGGRERVDMLSGLQRLHREYGNVVLQDAGPLQMVNLYGPDANRLVLLDRDRIFSAKKPWTSIMGKIFPNGLLLRDGEEHRHQRKVMQEAFTRPSLRQYLEHMNPMIERGMSAWHAERKPFLAYKAFKELTLDIAASIFIGLDLGPEMQRVNRVFENLVAASMSRIRLSIPGLEFRKGLKGREFMIDYFTRMVEEKRASGCGLDMLSRLCRAESEEGNSLGNQEIIDHMIFLMMAAHDTTTSTLSSMTYELARNRQWQERIREESFALDNEHLPFEDLDRLDALTWVIKETLRRYPPLPVIPRVATREFEFEGYLIPKGAMVVISPIHTHHMAEWWNDPLRFDPERFSPRRAEDERHSHSWIPFGGGPHMCLGMRFAELQIKAIVHQLVRRVRWSVPDEYRMPVQQAPISKPRDGLPIELELLD